MSISEYVNDFMHHHADELDRQTAECDKKIISSELDLQKLKAKAKELRKTSSELRDAAGNRINARPANDYELTRMREQFKVRGQ